MKTIYEIKVTGTGSLTDIAKALHLISIGILEQPLNEIDGAEWMDCSFLTEIKEESPIMGSFDKDGNTI